VGEIDANSRKINAIVICIAAFLTGAIVMSFEMLGSRYLNPYFGNGIYTWAALISTVLAALSAGHFLGGFMPIARYPHEVCAAPSAAPPQPHPGERPGGARPKKRASRGSQSSQQCSVCKEMPAHSEQDDCSFALRRFNVERSQRPVSSPKNA